MARNERLKEWLAVTYKTDPTLIAAAKSQISARTLTGWKAGTSEPSAPSLALLYELGLGVHWYLVGEGEMFSDSPKGRAFAKEHGGRTSRRKAVDRTADLIAEIDELLNKYR